MAARCAPSAARSVVVGERAHSRVHAEREVRALIPRDPRLAPVAPEVAHLVGRHEPVGDAAEDRAVLVRHLRLERERRDHAQHLRHLRLGETRVQRGALLPGPAVPVERAREVHRGNARDRARELVVERREQRGGVAAEREAVHADRRIAAAADPGEQPPQVPHRLRLGVDRVEQIAAEEAVSAAAPDAARPVQREHRDEQVQAVVPVQPVRMERAEVDQRLPHPVAVQADQPGRTRISAHDPGMGGAVGLVAEPALAPGLAGARLVFAAEREVLVVEAARAAPHRVARAGVGRARVIGLGLLQPSRIRELLARDRDFAFDPPVILDGREELGEHHRAEHRLVDADLGREADGRNRLGHALGMRVEPQRVVAGREERPRGGDRERERDDAREGERERREQHAEHRAERGEMRDAAVAGVEQHARPRR